MDTMTLQQNMTSSVSVTPVTNHSAPSHEVTHHAESSPQRTETLQQNQNKNELSTQEQEALQKSVEKFNEMSEKLDLDVKFAYNDKIDQIYLNVIDKNTGQTIRKLPSEEAMKIAESMKDLVGALFDKKG